MVCGCNNPSDPVRMCLTNLPLMLNNDTRLLPQSLMITEPSGNPMAALGKDNCPSPDPPVPPRVLYKLQVEL